MGRIDISTFIGDWSDSLRHNVVVWESNRGLQVSLAKADGSGREILLTIKKAGPGGFVCGHYDLDAAESSDSKIVWRDNRFSDRITVWTRKGRDRGEREYREQDHRDRQHRDREHRDREPRERESRDRDYRDRRERDCVDLERDCRDRDYRDRGYQDRDSRDRDYQDREQEDHSSDGHLSHHRDRDPKASDVGGHSRLPSLPESPARTAASVPGDLDLPKPCEGAPSQDLKQQAIEDKSSAAPAWQIFQDTNTNTLPGIPPPWKAPSPSGPGNTWTSPPWASAQAVAIGQPPPPTGPLAGSPSMQPVHTVWSQHSDGFYPGPAGSFRPTSSASPAPTDASNDSDLDKILSALAAAAGNPGTPHYATAPVMASSAQPVAGHTTLGPSSATAAPSEPVSPVAPWRRTDTATGPLPPPAVAPPPGKAATDPSPGWNEVLQLLEAAANPTVPRTAAEVPAGQIDELFSPFGLPQPAPAEAAPSEAFREQVLVETLARLLREKHPDAENVLAGSTPPQGVVGKSADSSALLQSQTIYDEDENLPDWARKAKNSNHMAAPRFQAPVKTVQDRPREQPLDQFIRVFRLDELAATCLRKLQDDEAAFVIEACQGRLKYAANPSAVVMISIKNVANRVGRRYWGSREQSSNLENVLAAAGMGNSSGRRKPDSEPQLQMFEGDESPSASPSPQVDADPYGEWDGEEEEEEEEEDEFDCR